MGPFLKSLAEYSIKNFGTQNLATICFVFPNRRSGVFFKNYLMQAADKTFWMPEVLTISELFSRFTNLEKADPLDISFELYTIYSDISGSSESYEDFYHWGEMMISDFDEIDKYLVPAQKLFTNISDLKEIDFLFKEFEKEQIEVIKEFWKHFHVSENSEEQIKFLDSWKLLYPVYTRLRESLMKAGIGYEGMLYRQFAENIQAGDPPLIPWEKIIFAGFNALSTAEKILFRYFRSSGKGLFSWDYDEEYLSETNAEAGRFLRKNMEEFPAIETGINFDSLKNEKNIKIIELPSDILQARYLGKLLSERIGSISTDFDNTAIILGNENLLEPVISSLPVNIPYINITMGYPLYHTNVCSFTMQLLELQKNLSLQKSGGNRMFYFRDVLSIINHQYLHYFLHSELQEMINMIHKQNMIYVPQEFFTDKPLLKNIFIKIENVSEISVYLRNILTQIFAASYEDENPGIDQQLEKEYLLNILSRINKLEKIFEKYLSRLPSLFDTKNKTGSFSEPDSKNMSISDLTLEVSGENNPGDGGIVIYSRILGKILKSLRIPFEGEPLQGLQIMGILETRLLDFKNIIFLSMNEGIMPRSHSSNSFIPVNLKYAFGMPVREDHDAIYAYYFYRLLQRADDITLLYNSKTEGLKSGEKSRYLYQLEYLRPVKPELKTVAFHISTPAVQEIVVTKTSEIMRILDEYGESGNRSFAPTALTTWLDCRFRFYLSYIAGIRRQDEASEEIDAPLLGNILHQAMKLIYKNIRGQKIEGEIFKTLNNEVFINDCINQAFLREFNRIEKSEGMEFKPEGRNIIVYEVIKKFVDNILEFDSNQLPFTIIDLEKKYQMLIPVYGRKVRISGYVDRIDSRNTSICLIDYKTGMVRQNFRSLQSLFDTEANERFKEVFQIFMYSYLYMRSVSDSSVIIPQIYALRDIQRENFSPYVKIAENPHGLTDQSVNDFSVYSREFEIHLVETLNEIFDPLIDFTQTTNLKRCIFCPYNRICHRDQNEAVFK